MEDQSSTAFMCPSFSSYSSQQLVEAAARVADELRRQSEHALNNSSLTEALDHNEEFAFPIVRADLRATTAATSSAIFCDSQIGPVFPIFNRGLLRDDADNRETHDGESENRDISSIRISLNSLLIEERELERDVPSSSSSEADGLEGIPPGIYCIWPPSVAQASPGRCKKSRSTGSVSKRWKFRDFLKRSNSDGNNSFVFLAPSTSFSTEKKTDKKSEKCERIHKHESSEKIRNSFELKIAGKAKATGVSSEKVTSAHEAFYVRNRAMKEGEKRRSYLPYKPDLVGLFANADKLSRAFPSF